MNNFNNCKICGTKIDSSKFYCDDCRKTMVFKKNKEQSENYWERRTRNYKTKSINDFNHFSFTNFIIGIIIGFSLSYLALIISIIVILSNSNKNQNKELFFGIFIGIIILHLIFILMI
ncbi:MAG: hypothetical protein ACOCQD_03290 [archaeon]